MYRYGGWMSGACSTPDDVIGRADRALSRVHHAERPSWACTGCGEQWPCAIARLILWDEYVGEGYATTLRVVMACYLYQATTDLGRAAPGELFDRFLRWVIESENRQGRAVGCAPVPAASR
jgi:hypothetical protein